MKVMDIPLEKMVDETFQMIKDNPLDDCQNLISYFEKKLHQDVKNKFFRISLSGRELDLPQNWSIFKHLDSNVEIIINKFNNPDFLFDIFHSLDATITSEIISKKDGQPSFVFIRKIERELIAA